MSPTEPRKSPKQDRARATVTAILDATARILAKEGFEAVNTNRVAEVAGVSVGSLYQYFPNKTAMVGAVAVRHTESMAAVIAAGVNAAPHDNLPRLVKALIRATMQAHAENPRLRRAIIEELPRIGRPARIAELKRNILQSVVELLAAHRAELEVRDLPTAAFVAVNTIEHITHVAQTMAYGPRDFARLERELNDLTLAYLIGRRG
ncbi:TetR/AcrR family transcriptional regulator [Bradyrhizobium sp. UFLA05-109]